MSQPSTGYTFAFAAGLCLICATAVAGAAVSLKDRQDANKVLDRQKKVLAVAGLMEPGEKITPDEVQARFDKNITAKVVDMESGDYAADVDAKTYDQRKAAKDPATSKVAPANKAKVQRVPNNALVYHVAGDGGSVEQLIVPIEGKGLWSTLYGFLAIDKDAQTIKGITFYEHAETPGLGGEVDNPSWKAKWPGRKVYSDDGSVGIRVIKGAAGPPKDAPYNVDGLSGATITANGVTNTLAFWMGPEGFKPYLDKFKAGGK
jgi:Na+-transporting NADH:ubiquinone oxidoreductase subunit C